MSGTLTSFTLWLCVFGLTGGLRLSAAPVLPNRHAAHPPVITPAEGLHWPAGQALPTFALPAAGLDTLLLQGLTSDEQITFSAFQGRVNRKKPRVLLIDGRAEEGRFTWLETPGMNLTAGQAYDRENKFQLMEKYAAELSGVVLYDPQKSPHYRNLAATAAGLINALPVTAEVFAAMKERGISLPVLEDLTSLPHTTALEIHQYLLDRYWPKCGKRILVSAKPLDERGRGDYHHTRDIAAATGEAMVWLDTTDPAERNMLRRFFADMKAGEAIALGWYTTERTGIPTASEFGIGTMPADFFNGASVYAGVDHRIHIPVVPKMPALQKKMYVAVFISDGDNIQYTQHAMRRNWDRLAGSRGRMALNWTMAPGLVDIAPGILNYYYLTATPLDCFVAGPSGMGYMMPFNTLKEPGAPVGDSLTDPARMDGYARLTETYLQRSGLRAVTVWDDATPMQRKSYEANCRQLYGVTVQNFRDVPSVAGSVENGRLRFDRLAIPYAGSFDHIHSSLKRRLERWDGHEAAFHSYQVDVWGELKADRLVALKETMEQEFPGKIEFVRADHYFNLYNEANNLPFNLCLASSTIMKGSAGQSPETAAAAMDGTPATVWSSVEGKNATLEFDFGGARILTRLILRHAGSAGLDPALNTRDFSVQGSLDGTLWTDICSGENNTANVTDYDLPAGPPPARFVRIRFADPGVDGQARMADVEIFGKP
ncbi:MAG: hypothetical protein JWL81_2618 [Verrucomicrobiales bacterium]|nr:hypothetical protein [Verrucomicrobiales bacterium]